MKIALKWIVVCCGLITTFNSASAQNWTMTSAPSNHWYSVASSADGTKLAAVANNSLPTLSGQIYVSTNSGTFWTLSGAPDTNWISIASSADGTKLVAAFVVPQGGQVYTSSNSGTSWKLTSAPNTNWHCVASSADGNKIVAVALGGPICTSTNSGEDWATAAVPSNRWASVGCSADGNTLVAVVSPGSIYTSTDSGANWIAGPDGTWFCSASSVDGTKLAVGGYDTNAASAIYVSTNSGMTWKPTSAPSVPSWGSLAFSADGADFIASGYPGPIYSSKDLGESWLSNSAPIGLWSSVRSSADGHKSVTVAWNGPIYTSQSTPSPLLNILYSNNNLALSWTLPSTNFTLQQNWDLSAPNWVTISNKPILNLTNLQNEVFLPPPASKSFYRLVSP